MRLFIPACGDRLTLTKPWTFRLFLESRNIKFARHRDFVEKDAGGEWCMDVHIDDDWKKGLRVIEVTFPEGTILECDRVYIRTFNKSRVQEGDDYDSITWKIIDPKKGKPEKHGRFWVKLSDANEIEYELQEDSRYRDRVKLFKEVMEA